jgi:hypothetical protein
MEDNNDLGNVLNDQPNDTTPPEEPPVEPVDTGETPPAEPPAAKQEPDLVPRAALMDERRKRQELEQWVRQNQPKQVVEPPKPEQFETTEAYLEALTERKASELFEKKLQEVNAQQRQMAVERQVADDTASLKAAGAAKYADFNEVIGNPDLPITDAMVNAMMAIDSGSDVAYYLGKNPHEAARIAQLPPTSQAREIGQLAKKVVAPPPSPPNLPKTLTTTRSTDGRFASNQVWSGPSPLNDILGKRN